MLNVVLTCPDRGGHERRDLAPELARVQLRHLQADLDEGVRLVDVDEAHGLGAGQALEDADHRRGRLEEKTSN